MKLFALASTTAVTARSWSRVEEPAPGFVNEQGGYWADQPTHPQAPQPNYQVHQPYVQKPQCCEGYTWISPTSEPVWLKKSGEHHDKPVYKGKDQSGVERVLFWAFSSAGNAPAYALTGHWYLSSSVDERSSAITKSQESLGLRYCPQDYQSLPYTNDMDFTCGQGPQQQQPNPNPHPHREAETCADIQAQPHQKMFITTGSPAPPFTDKTFCHIHKMMNQLVIRQVNDLVQMFDHTQKPHVMSTAFPKAVEAWRKMTEKDWANGGVDNCGFWNDFRFGETGFIMTDSLSCDNFCDDIKKIEKPEDFKNVLEDFLTLVDTKFDKGT